jgi:solute carrier family 25 S-adenosylmethionine transporter 26
MASLLYAVDRRRATLGAPGVRAAFSRRGRLARPQATPTCYVETSSLTAVQPAAPAGKALVDILAGAAARAASQSTIHPLDTLKVRMQATARGGVQCASAASKYGLGAGGGAFSVSSLYKGVGGAAGGAGIAIGTYFAFYGAAMRLMEKHTTLPSGARAFVAGAAGAVGSSFVKVPAAVCIRSVQANIYPNVMAAAACITRAAGVRGLYTGYVPTVLEDVPDMAVKFAAYESMRVAHARITGKSRDQASRVDDLLMGGTAGALAAAATTPLDVLKTRMMCSAASRPTLSGAFRAVVSEGKGVAPFFRGVGPRALSNGINSAMFFMFFEIIRAKLKVMAAKPKRVRSSVASPTVLPAMVVVVQKAPRVLAEASLSSALVRRAVAKHQKRLTAEIARTD